MYCQNCGMKNMDDAVFCENCGEKLEEDRQYVPSIYEGQVVLKKPFSKLTLFLALEFVSIILLIYGLVASSKNLFSAGQEAEDYFVHMANGDFKQAYGKLDVSESEFINARQFESANAASSLGVIGNYQVQKNGLDRMMGQNSPLSETVTIQYQSEGESMEYKVVLNRQIGKKYFLFDDWKVDASSRICKGYMVYVPKGAKVVLDDVSLSGKYMADPGSFAEEFLYEESLPDGAMEAYQIPEIFYGIHNIAVTMEDMENVTEKIQITEENQKYQLGKMQMKQEAAETLIRTAGKNMETIYHAALCGQDFRTITSIFTADKGILSDIQKSYEDLASSVQESSSKPYSIQFSNISGDVSSDYGSPVYLSFAYDLAYTYTDWWNDDVQKGTYSGNGEWEFCFVKENGKWVQSSLGCESLYY